MKQFSIIISLLLQCSLAIYCQNDDSVKTEFLKHAPPRVKEYYHVFDSLAHPTWNHDVSKTWSDTELKRYASLIVEADDYDAMARKKDNHNRMKTADKNGYTFITTDHNILDEIKKRYPKMYYQIIRAPLWLTIVVDDIETQPYALKDIPQVVVTQKRIQAKVLNMWRGSILNVDDPVVCYYYPFWNPPNIVKGKSYVVALYPNEDEPGIIEFALGGANGMNEFIYPIENNIITDDNNLFGLGNHVEKTTFTNKLTTLINEIKSWKDGGR
jgi:hypothetical protein